MATMVSVKVLTAFSYYLHVRDGDQRKSGGQDRAKQSKKHFPITCHMHATLLQVNGALHLGPVLFPIRVQPEVRYRVK